MEFRVDNSIRKRNKLAIEKRNQWRKRYHAIVQDIKHAKQERNRNPQSLHHKIRLESLQTMASLMMRERAILSMELQDSAYEWV